jgi:hypothetical protein
MSGGSNIPWEPTLTKALVVIATAVRVVTHTSKRVSADSTASDNSGVDY